MLTSAYELATALLKVKRLQEVLAYHHSVQSVAKYHPAVPSTQAVAYASL
jgi:hypothetical protein